MITTKEHVLRWRKAHHDSLATLGKAGADGLSLWRKLGRIEGDATSATTAYCNGHLDNIDDHLELMAKKVERVFGKLPAGFFINRDPRGYALKIDPDKGKVPPGMYTDWGRYGILAPVIE